jgi:N-6 DNA Methylase
MKEDSTQALMRAHALLPHLPQTPGMGEPLCLGIVICILAWFKVCSDHWHARQNEGQPTSALAEGGFVNMTADCTFDAILKEKGASTAKAILKAIDELVKLNPTLKGVLQPGHFVGVQSLYEKYHAHPDSLHKLVATINEIRFESHAPSFACAAEFAAVITAVCKDSNAPARAFTPLCAQLLKPQANEVVLDLACGQGHLLLACAKALAETTTPATKPASAQAPAKLYLHGMAHDVRQSSLAKLSFCLAGLPHDHIQHANALKKPLNDFTAPEKALALGEADIVVMAIPETTERWRHALACQQQDPRFPVGAPASGSLALVWQGLAALKPEGGRMALIMPNAVLAATGGYTLCKYLVDNNLLDAVITLPDMVGQLLLMIRRQKRQTDIAFIVAQGRDTAGTASALQAYQHYQSEQNHPRLICLAQSTVAAKQYRLDLQIHGAAVSSFYAQAMPTVLPS